MKKFAKLHMINAFVGKLACQLFLAKKICQMRNMNVLTSSQKISKVCGGLFPRYHLPECLQGQHGIGILKREYLDLMSSSRIKLSAIDLMSSSRIKLSANP